MGEGEAKYDAMHEQEALQVPSLSHFDAILTLFHRLFDAILTPFERRFNAILTLF